MDRGRHAPACHVSNGIPIDLFEVDRPAPTAEQRAATPAPGTGTGTTVAPVQPFVFAPSIATRLGIDMPSVGSGAYSEMTISTALPAAPRAKGVALASTAGALTPVTDAPRRIGSRLTLALEDVAAVGQANFEAALRGNVSMALSDALDSQIINGNGTSPNIEGLINQLTDPTNPSAIAGFDDYVAAFADQIDGLWAGRVSDVAIVANVAAYKLSAKTFRDRVIEAVVRSRVLPRSERRRSHGRVRRLRHGPGAAGVGMLVAAERLRRRGLRRRGRRVGRCGRRLDHAIAGTQDAPGGACNGSRGGLVPRPVLAPAGGAAAGPDWRSYRAVLRHARADAAGRQDTGRHGGQPVGVDHPQRRQRGAATVAVADDVVERSRNRGEPLNPAARPGARPWGAATP